MSAGAAGGTTRFVPDESRRTVTVALLANVGVAAVKFTGAALTGSAALFAEGAQSVSDTLNEAFLLTSLFRSRRPADEQHPFGYGKERFFWALLACVGIFVAGAGFSLLEAYRAFTAGAGHGGGRYFLIAYVSLGLVGIFEGTSWVRAVRQLRSEAAAAGRGVLEHLRISSDPSVKTVAGEDSAALIGVLLAFGGIGLHQATGHGWWEGVAAALIAVLLVVTAFTLGHDVKGLLLDEAADPRTRHELRSFLCDQDGVDQVLDLMTMRLGAEKLLLAARIDLDPGLDSDQVEVISGRIDRAVNERWPEVTEVFLDATRAGERRPASR